MDFVILIVLFRSTHCTTSYPFFTNPDWAEIDLRRRDGLAFRFAFDSFCASSEAGVLRCRLRCRVRGATAPLLLLLVERCADLISLLSAAAAALCRPLPLTDSAAHRHSTRSCKQAHWRILPPCARAAMSGTKEVAAQHACLQLLSAKLEVSQSVTARLRATGRQQVAAASRVTQTDRMALLLSRLALRFAGLSELHLGAAVGARRGVAVGGHSQRGAAHQTHKSVGGDDLSIQTAGRV